MKLLAVALLLVSVVAVSGCIAGAPVQPESQSQTEDVVQSDGTILKPDGTMVKPDGTMVKPDGTMVKPDGTMVAPDGTMTKPDETMMKGGAEDAMKEDGTVAMAKAAPYVDYTETAFAEAQAAGKTTYLYFFAAWCPICRAHDPTVADAIATGPSGSGFDAERVAAFRVNYDLRGEAHAKCQPSYQHYTCILQGSAVAFKTGQVQDKAAIISTLGQYV